jgi:hypothetical protein
MQIRKEFEEFKEYEEFEERSRSVTAKGRMGVQVD